MTAHERIEATRARLRAAMNPRPAANVTARRDERGAAASPPLQTLMLDSLKAWWEGHALRPALLLANEASAALIRPIARRNPIALMFGAALVGVGVMRLRPWRWGVRSALLASLLPHIAARLASASLASTTGSPRAEV